MSFELVYGHDGILPLEVLVKSHQLLKHWTLAIDKYTQELFLDLEEIAHALFLCLKDVEGK